MPKTKKSYTTLSFSTNISEISPLFILKLFLNNKLCSNIKYIDRNRIDYDYLLNNNTLVHSIFVEAKQLYKTYKISFMSDSYLIIIDLEKDNSFK